MNRSRLAVVLCALAAGGPLSAQPVLTISQPFGPGSFDLSVTSAGAGAELFNLISLYPAIPTGSGAFLGLNLVGSNLLLDQITSPLSTHPFHVTADGVGSYSFAFSTAPVSVSIPIDACTVEWSPIAGIVGLSPVVSIALAF